MLKKLVFTFIYCQIVTGAVNSNSGEVNNVCNTKSCQELAQSINDAIDTSVNPCDNFYEYACNGWIKRNPIPPSRGKMSHLDELDDKLNLALKNVLENNNNKRYEPFTKVDTFYKSCMNEAQIEKLGDEPIKSLLKKYVGGWPVLEGKLWNENKFDWIQSIANLGRAGAQFLINPFIISNTVNNKINVLTVDQPRFEIPGSFLIFPLFAKQKSEYCAYQQKVAALLQNKPLSDAQKKEQMNACTFEVFQSQLITLLNFRSNISALYNPMTVKEFYSKFGKEINYEAYFKTLLKGVTTLKLNDIISVQDANYYSKLGNLIKQTPKRIIANFLSWKILEMNMKYLPKKYFEVRKEFEKAISGKDITAERWKTCAQLTNADLKLLTGKLYVNEYFSGNAKSTIDSLINYERDVFKDILRRTSWMDSVTKDVALRKLDALIKGIGYPDLYNQPYKLLYMYKRVKFNVNTFLENHVNILTHETLRKFCTLRKPYNKDDFFDSPALIDALNNVMLNMLVFPAAILQPPFFEPDSPRVKNYASIGSIIGHELTHGFDSAGKEFGIDGSATQWWKEPTLNTFNVRANCMKEQYSSYKVPELNSSVDGETTLGENIADNGGLKIAYEAYLKSNTEQGMEYRLPNINFTPEQLFFVCFAQTWCTNYRDEELKIMFTSDVHSPANYRVIGPLSNYDEFRKAFNCPADSKMVSQKPCVVW